MSQEKIDMVKTFLQGAHYVDLSHKLSSKMSAFFGQQPFKMTLAVSKEKDGTPFIHSNVAFNEHTGTHMDAPSHFYFPLSIDNINPAQMIGRAAVINRPGQLTATKADVLAWEKENGDIEEGDYVLFGFGWAQYFNTEKFASTPWPGLTADAAEYLVGKKVKGLGVDTLTLDVSTDTEYSCHQIALKNNVLIIENLNNLERLPAWCLFACLPLPFENGTASPVRPIAVF